MSITRLLCVFLLFCWFSPNLFCTGLPLVFDTSDKPISPYVEQVYIRFYFLSRYVAAFDTLNQLAQTDEQLEKRICNHLAGYYSNFHHERIRVCLNDIQKLQSLAPVLRCWEIFSCFRFIDDSVYQEELFSLLEKILCFVVRERGFSFDRENHNLSHFRCLQIIDSYMDMLQGKDKELISAYGEHKVLEGIEMFHVNLAYYVIGRIRFLLPAISNNISYSCLHDNAFVKHLKKTVFFENNFIQQCFIRLLECKNAMPIEYLNHVTLSYRFANDILVVKDYLRFLIVTSQLENWKQEWGNNVARNEKTIAFVMSALNDYVINQLLVCLEGVLSYNKFSDQKKLAIYEVGELENKTLSESEKSDLIYREVGINRVRFANLLARRLYFIERFSYEAAPNKRKEESVFSNLSGDYNETRGYKVVPLFMVWQDFVQLKHLEAQLYIEDYTKEVLVIMPTDQSKDMQDVFELSQMRSILHDIPQYFEKKNFDIPFYPFLCVADTCPYYSLIERLRPLARFCKDHMQKRLKLQSRSLSLFNHQDIISFFSEGKRRQGLENLWIWFTRYKYILDQNFVHQFSLLLCVLSLEELNEQEKKYLRDHYDAKQHCSNISSLNEKEVLELVDAISDTLYDLRQHNKQQQWSLTSFIGNCFEKIKEQWFAF